MQLTHGQILIPNDTCNLFDTPHRVLHIDAETDTVWGIALPRFRENGHVVGYVTGPTEWGLETLTKSLEAGQIALGSFSAPSFWALSDCEFISPDLPATERDRRKALQLKRNESWAAIEPIIKGFSLAELLTAPSVRTLINKRAKACCRSTVTIYRLLHLYLAHGSVINGMYPMTDRCGAKGKDRQQRKPVGRPPLRLKRDGVMDSRFLMSAIDKTRCGVAYAMVSKSCPISTARARMNYTYYSTLKVKGDGAKHATLLDQNNRPSPKQFIYWGRKLTAVPEFRERHGLPSTTPNRKHRGGSSRELARAVGECAQFDGTSTDVYLVSLYDRRIKLPPPTRSPVIEQMSGVLLAPFVGWQHPSASTALQAIYLGAIDKAEICERFDIRIPRDYWPGLLCRKYLVDGGEARCQEVLDFAAQFQIDMEFAPSYAGAAKPDVETSHHSDHKTVDHQLPGSTLGQQRERGQPHPADFALWNYYEYTREYLLSRLEALEFEDEARAPTQLLAKGLRPSRINVLKWYMDRGQRADIAFSRDQLLAMTLPTFDAVIQYNGVVLKYPDSDHRILELRYFSEKLRDDERYQRAAASRHVIKARVKFDQQNLGELWLLGGHEMIRCRNKSSDDYLIVHGTLEDLIQHRQTEAVYRAEHQQACDQATADTVARRDTTSASAAAELKAQQGSIKIPKTKKHARLRPNADAEQQAIESAGLTLTKAASTNQPIPAAGSDSPPAKSTTEISNAAARAVAALVHSLPSTGGTS